MKLKHNKKRNTAFLYEILIKELTKCIISKDTKRKGVVVAILREHFSKNSALAKELEIYKVMNETTSLELETAKSLISESKLEFKTLKENEIFKSQSRLISQINKSLSKGIFNNFVPNYKDLATIVQMFNSSTPLKTRVMLEAECLERLVSKRDKNAQALQPVSNLAYRSFVGKFNEKYGKTLQKEQCELLQNYILSFSDNGIGIKLFMNEELARLKATITQSLSEEKDLYDEHMVEKAQQVLQLLEDCKKQPLDRAFIGQVLKIQTLAREIES
tara:strand:- start:2858 stop:3679 length:822 start_codon:yes stop_codon:yes gene_type:complete